MADAILIYAQQNMDTIGLKYIHQYLRQEGIESLLLYIPVFKSKIVIAGNI